MSTFTDYMVLEMAQRIPIIKGSEAIGDPNLSILPKVINAPIAVLYLQSDISPKTLWIKLTTEANGWEVINKHLSTGSVIKNSFTVTEDLVANGFFDLDSIPKDLESFTLVYNGIILSEGIDDDFADGDKIQVWIPGRGDIVNALLRDEETIAIGDWLMSDGEGRLMLLAITAGESGEVEATRPAVGVAVNAVDLSTLPEGSESSAGGLYHNPRIQVRII